MVVSAHAPTVAVAPALIFAEDIIVLMLGYVYVFLCHRMSYWLHGTPVDGVHFTTVIVGVVGVFIIAIIMVKYAIKQILRIIHD